VKWETGRYTSSSGVAGELSRSTTEPDTPIRSDSELGFIAEAVWVHLSETLIRTMTLGLSSRSLHDKNVVLKAPLKSSGETSSTARPSVTAS